MTSGSRKAEADYQGAVDLRRRRKTPLRDLVCFHCQQCAEKYLKAFLVAQGEIPPRTHDLLHLLALASAHDASLSALAPQCALLSAYGVDSRYPGMMATEADMVDALKAVRRVRRVLRSRLGL